MSKLAVIRNGTVENVVEVTTGTWNPPAGATTVDVSAVPCSVGWAHVSGTTFTPPAEPPPPSHTDTADVRISAVESHAGSPHAPSNAQKNSDITKAEIEAKLTGAVASHTHAYEAVGAVAAHEAAADPHAGYQREIEKGAANGYASLDAGGKVPSAQLPASGGADPWTYVVLGSDFLTSSATAVNVTGLMFTPAANTRYEFKASLRTRTATTTVGPRPGLSWPTGFVDGVCFLRQSSGAGTIVMVNGNANAALLAPVGGVPNTTQSHPAWIEGEIAMGASPSGNVQVQLASETAGTNVTIKAGSVLAYRTF